MGWLIWLIILAALCFFAFLAWKYRDEEPEAGGWGIVCGILAAILIVVEFSPVLVVPVGSTYTERFMGNVPDTIYPSGTYLVNPLASFDKYTTRGFVVETHIDSDNNRLTEDQLLSFTSEGSPVTVVATFQGRFGEQQLPWLRRNRGSQEAIVKHIVRPAMQSAIRSATARFTLNEVLTDRREELAQQMQDICNAEVARSLQSLGLSARDAAEAFQCLSVIIVRAEVPERVMIARAEEAAAPSEAGARRIQGEGIREMTEATPNLTPAQLAELQRAGADVTRANADRQSVENGTARVVVSGGGEVAVTTP